MSNINNSCQGFSQAHYDTVSVKYGDANNPNDNVLDKYDTIFIDSITVAGRLCFNWYKSQPQMFSKKTGKPDTRGAYGLQAREMIVWLTHLQHTRVKNIWFVGILIEAINDFNRRLNQPQIEGSKTALELPGIVDQVITMCEVSMRLQAGTEMTSLEGKPFRAFICHTINAQGYPTKDRSVRLDEMEEPHLGRLCQKISGTAKPAEQRLTYAVPEPTEQSENNTRSSSDAVAQSNNGGQA